MNQEKISREITPNIHKQQKEIKNQQMEEYKKMYHRKEVKVPSDQKHFKKYYFAPSFSITIQGSSNSGKSYQLQEAILDKDYQFFEYFPPHNIYIISPNINFDKSMQPLIQYLKKSDQFDEREQVLTDLKGMEQYINNIMKFQEELRDYGIYRPICILLDDIIGSQEIHNMKPLDKLYTMGRHLHISPILLIQNITSISPLLRKNSQIIWIFRTFNHQDLKALLEQVRGSLESKTIKQIYEQCVEEDYSFLMFDKRQSKQYVYSRKLDNVLQVDYDQ